MQRNNKLCARSEPKHVSRKKWSELEQSIVNHPNFEKAAVLVQLLGEANKDNKASNPHRIGSLPRGKAAFDPNPDTKTLDAAVKLVKNVIRAKEAENQAEGEEYEPEKQMEEPPEIRKVNNQPEVKNTKGTKPYVINIYLDTKQPPKSVKDDDIKKKIKEFWEEQKRTQVSKTTAKHKEKKSQMPIFVSNEMVAEEQQPEEPPEEEDSPPRRDKKSHKTKHQLAKHSEELDEQDDEKEASETLTDIPRYQIEHVKKLYPDPTSTANPHTERLRAGTPANYDLNSKIKEVISSVNPVSPSGFGKYLTIWKQIWNKRQDAKEEEEGQDSQRPATYTGETVEDDQAKQAFKVIENDKIFMTKNRRYHPYEPKHKGEEDAEEVTETAPVDDNPDVERRSRSNRRYGHQQRSFYSTFSNNNPYGANMCPDDSLRYKSKPTTRLQISEFNNYDQYRKYRNYNRCDAKTAGGSAGSKLPDKQPKINRVEEFVDKFKTALATESKGEFKKVSVVYGSTAHDSDKQRVKVKISKLKASKSECRLRKENDEEAAKKDQEKFRGKSHSAKKNK